MASQTSSKKVIYAALIGNFLIAVTKFVAAAWTGSSAMLSEGVHSLVDTGNELLLLYGLHRSKKPPDKAHPLGHGRELYFWTFIVALLIFSLGAGVSIYEGIVHLRHPEPMENPLVAYVVLGLSLLFEGGSWWIALKEFRKAKGRLGYFRAVRESKDPTTFTVLFEDTAALAGLLIALAGVAAAQYFEMPELDGMASLGIGVVLAVTALVLARETKGLLIGEAANKRLEGSVLAIAQADPAVERANGVVTVHLAPNQVVAALSAEFSDELRTPDIEACVTRVETKIRQAHPEITTLFIKPQSAGTYHRHHPATEAAIRHPADASSH
ncbi:cation diffusion facilitator family transporter [Microvirga sp. 17 mud 1-3]|uniref:cation diffusion facilitator family transporter n=1 Tax=Microvirga sp. 17 mud 1-3 TaxID=2082949 RepID=UPI000D6CB36F|nr:cation diffusion facilitator family transporter [Microvirga sp. 17 mud 1-3]AWM86330.1 cation transporter [Microvirga sp. 17 mud 1-3]